MIFLFSLRFSAISLHSIMFHGVRLLFQGCPLLKEKGFFVSSSKLQRCDSSDKIPDSVVGKSTKLV